MLEQWQYRPETVEPEPDAPQRPDEQSRNVRL